MISSTPTIPTADFSNTVTLTFPVIAEGFDIDERLMEEVMELFPPLARAIFRYAKPQSEQRQVLAKNAIFRALRDFAISVIKSDVLPPGTTARSMRFCGATMRRGTRMKTALKQLGDSVPEIGRLNLWRVLYLNFKKRALSSWHRVQIDDLEAGFGPDRWHQKRGINSRIAPEGNSAPARTPWTVSPETSVEPRLVRLMGYLRQMQLNGLIGRFCRAVETSFKKGRTINLFRHYLPFLRQRDGRGMADEAAYLLGQAISRLRIRPGAA